MAGKLLVNREWLFDEVWLAERFTKGQAWLDLVGLAQYQPGIILVHGVIIKLDRGDVGWSISRLSTRWQWDRSTTKAFLDFLKINNKITYKTNNKISTIISIQNYDLGQSFPQQNPNQSPQQNDEGVHNRTSNRTSNRTHTNNTIIQKHSNVLPKGNTAAAKPDPKKAVVYGDGAVNRIIKGFVDLYGFPPTDRQPRNEAWNLVRAMRKMGQEVGHPLTPQSEEKLIVGYFAWIEKQDWSDGIQGLGTIRRKFPIWRLQLEESLKEGRSHVPQEN